MRQGAREITSAGVRSEASAAVRARVAAAVVGICGALVLWVVGFSHLEPVHNAAHDARHSHAFPCH
jgi:cobalt transporter subunit CbtB